MPFGLINAPVTFQRVMDGVLKWLDFVHVYLEDVFVFPKTIEEQMEHLIVVI